MRHLLFAPRTDRSPWADRSARTYRWAKTPSFSTLAWGIQGGLGALWSYGLRHGESSSQRQAETQGQMAGRKPFTLSDPIGARRQRRPVIRGLGCIIQIFIHFFLEIHPTLLYD